jgi:hypothetical protein
MGNTVDELLAGLPRVGGSRGCWGSRLEGDAATFIAGVQARESKGLKFRRAAIQAVLKREWDVTIGEHALRRHLNGTCTCK